VLNAEFLLTSLIVVLIPGTGAIYTISTGIFLGWRASVAAAVGCTAGILPHLLASILGLTLVLHVSAVVFQGLKFVGAAYLLYLAWQMWRDNNALTFNSAGSSKSAWQIVLKAFLLNILNPKLTIFFLAFLPLFISRDAVSPILEMLFLSAVFMLITLLVFVVYGVLASAVRNFVLQSPKILFWLRRSFAVIFAALGVRLAIAD
jgi:threonine/homoserine/homoserine lactone efflux protein